MKQNWAYDLNQVRHEILRECAGHRYGANSLLFLSKTANEVHYALEKGANPNADDQSIARSLIHHDGFFADQKYDCLNTLFEAGLKKDAVNSERKTLLHDCTDDQAIYVLLDNHVHHGALDAYGCTAVQSLLCENAWGSAHVLLENNASLKGWNNGRSLPLVSIVGHIVRFWALWPSEIVSNLLRTILAEIPPPNEWSEDTRRCIESGLYSAHQNGEEWVAMFPKEFLTGIENEDNSHVWYPKVFKQSPLWLAASCNDIGVIKYMLKVGSNIDETDARGQTALHAAVASQSLQSVELLLGAGANPNIQDLKGKTCLHTLQKLRKDQNLLHGDAHHFNIDLLLAHLLHSGADTAVVDDAGIEAGCPLTAMPQSPKDITELNMHISVQTYNTLLDIHCRDKLNEIVQGGCCSTVRRM